MLDWAESMEDTEITFIEAQQASGAWMVDSWEDMARQLWGFVKHCLKGDAKEACNTIAEGNGLETWRVVNRIIDQGRPQRLEVLRQELKRVGEQYKMKNLEHVQMGVTKFENLVRRFEDAGGERMSDAIRKTELLDLLPEEMRDHVLWHATDPKANYRAFRNHVVMQSAKILLHRRRLPVHGLDEKNAEIDMEGLQELEGGNLVAKLEELLYQAQRGGRPPYRPQGQGGANRSGDRGGDRGGGGQTTKTWRCLNCGSDKHRSQDCPKGRLEPNLRPCFNCGKPGHVTANCPLKKLKGGLNSVEESRQCAEWLGCLTEGFTKVSKERGARPQPRGATMGEIMSAAFARKNAFDALKEADNAESIECDESVSNDCMTGCVDNCIIDNCIDNSQFCMTSVGASECGCCNFNDGPQRTPAITAAYGTTTTKTNSRLGRFDKAIRRQACYKASTIPSAATLTTATIPITTTSTHDSTHDSTQSSKPQPTIHHDIVTDKNNNATPRNTSPKSWAKRRSMEAASFAGPPFDRLSEVSSRPFSNKLMEDVGRPFSAMALR